MVRPPEVYIYSLSDGKVGSIWSKEADIWAIGCIVSHFHQNLHPHVLMDGLNRHTKSRQEPNSSHRKAIPSTSSTKLCSSAGHHRRSGSRFGTWKGSARGPGVGVSLSCRRSIHTKPGNLVGRNATLRARSSSISFRQWLRQSQRDEVR